jgi:hypothetical protein
MCNGQYKVESYHVKFNKLDPKTAKKPNKPDDPNRERKCCFCDFKTTDAKIKEHCVNPANVVFDSEKFEVQLDLAALIDKNTREMVYNYIEDKDNIVCGPCFEKIVMEILADIKTSMSVTKRKMIVEDELNPEQIAAIDKIRKEDKDSKSKKHPRNKYKEDK